MQHEDEFMRSIGGMAEKLKAMHDTAYVQYAACVDAVIRDALTDITQIERMMDGLCDFGNDARFLELYRRLCRHIYGRHPRLVEAHVLGVWRQIWAEEMTDMEMGGDNDVCSTDLPQDAVEQYGDPESDTGIHGGV